MSPEIRKIAATYLNNPTEVTIGKKNTAQQNISHQYAVVQARDKYTALKRIIDFHEDFYGIVFCTTKAETQELSDHLVRDGYSADCLHGDLAQAQRDKVMHRFRHKAIKALLATDVAARGIDVKISPILFIIIYQMILKIIPIVVDVLPELDKRNFYRIVTHQRSLQTSSY